MCDLEVRDCESPAGSDGLARRDLHGSREKAAHPGSTPSRPEVRRRFTIAHEVGHLLLPWHVAGSFLCHTESASSFGPMTRAARFPKTEAKQLRRASADPDGLGSGELLESGRPEAGNHSFEAKGGGGGGCGVAGVFPLHVACIRLADVLPAREPLHESSNGGREARHPQRAQNTAERRSTRSRPVGEPLNRDAARPICHPRSPKRVYGSRRVVLVDVPRAIRWTTPQERKRHAGPQPEILGSAPAAS